MLTLSEKTEKKSRKPQEGKDRMDILLSELDWEVKGYWPYVPLKEKSMETGQTLHGVTSWIPAKVPGGVHADLFRAGKIEDPYFGQNSLKCEWAEHRWWMYRTSFPGEMQGVSLAEKKVTLWFQGLDYDADIFLNDEKIGEHRAGMFEPEHISIDGKIKAVNQLVVLFRGIPEEMGQIGYTSKTSTQKSRFNYKWDFSTRLVNIGFWKDVILRVEERASFGEPFLTSAWDGKTGRLLFEADVKDERVQKDGPLTFRMRVTGPYHENAAGLPEDWPDSDRNHPKEENVCLETEEQVEGLHVKACIELADPCLWYPNGCGRQPLYHVALELLEDQKVLYRESRKQGIRKITMAHNEKEHPKALPYTFCVNGRNLYIKGVNMTPLDHLYGTVTKEQYRSQVEAMVNAGVNLVRVWGGGLIEKEEFYDLCDENGILIWQEFIQSSSGIDNCPGEDASFLELLARSAEAAVKEKRNHTALAVYSGGNELMEAPDRPVGMEHPNIRILRKIVEKFDGARAFLPTSASGPREFVTKEKGVSHDVHGNWRYEGNPGHYELYGQSDNLFHSEFGMDGTASVKSLGKFLPEQSLCPTPMSEDENWQHHGEWWGTYFRDCEMFGPIKREPEDLEKFVNCSQYLQAEGLRFIIEADRRRAFQNSGVIVWQLNEPWPNASCTSLVDYYGEAKPAYYQVKKAYEPLHLSLDYRNLWCEKGSVPKWSVYVSNFRETKKIRGTIRVCAKAGQLLWEHVFEADSPGNTSKKLLDVEWRIPKEVPGELLLVRLTAEEEGRVLSENCYIFGTGKGALLAPLTESLADVRIEREEETTFAGGSIRKTLLLANHGSEAAVQVGVELIRDDWRMLGNDNFITLMPGEKKELKFLLTPRPLGAFEREKEQAGKSTPADFRVSLRWMGQKKATEERSDVQR